MSETTGIAWCDATINFWHGCKKVSEGCKFCYMYRDKDRYKQDGSKVLKTTASTIRSTLAKLNVQAMGRRFAGVTEPLKIFTCSWSDFFIDEADPWRDEAWQVIRDNPQFIWIILTKRPERIMQCLPADWGKGWDHVWLLVSAENQERFDERVPILTKIPAKVRGVSIEPMIGPVNILKFIPSGKGHTQYGHLLDWVIVGGESGNFTGKWGFRECSPAWIRDIVKDVHTINNDFGYGFECKLFIKQLGTGLANFLGLSSRSGSDVNEFPRDLRIQNFPNEEA